MNTDTLKDNAMFLSCWHERNRPVQLMCFVILIVGILLLSLLSISMSVKISSQIWETLFYVIAAVQAIILLLEGTIFAGYLASRERVSETLDFHRNSPQPVLEKITGLIIGSTWFEWVVFAALFVIELPFACLPNLSLAGIISFNVSLILTGIFFQTTAATFALVSPQKKRGSPIILVLIILFLGGPMIGYSMSSAHNTFFTHLLGVTALPYISHDSLQVFYNWFYILDLPPILLQAIVQIPLTLLMIKGMARVFSMPNSPAWSKEDVIRFCTFIFFMVTGFFVADYIHFKEIHTTTYYYRYSDSNPEYFIEQSTLLFMFLFGAIGFVFAFLTAPSYFKRTKYMVISGLKPLPSQGMFDDGASSLPSVLIFLAIGGLFMLPYLYIAKVSYLYGLEAFIMMCSHIIMFAGFLEFFRLGRFRSNKIFFVTTLIIIWAFVPWFASMLSNYSTERFMNLGSLSPFTGFIYITTALSSNTSWKEITFVPLLLPILAAAGIWILAKQEHDTIKNRTKS